MMYDRMQSSKSTLSAAMGIVFLRDIAIYERLPIKIYYSITINAVDRILRVDSTSLKN